MISKKIIARFPPSPTGFLHVGSLRTALYNYLFAKKHKGEFLLRIEDTDQSRKVAGAEENIIKTLNLLGLRPDNKKPLVQSKRLKIYQEFAQKLLSEKKAYYCFCDSARLDSLRKIQQEKKLPTKYDGKCRNLSEKELREKLSKKKPFVIRQKISPKKLVTFEDLIRGQVSINTDALDDQIIIKSDGFPTYHLASVVDDHEMKVSHVIRGEDWLSSTPKHILLYHDFGWEPPRFAHLPLLLNADKSKLSKRQGDVSVENYLDKGYLPPALLNFVLLLGWNPGTDKEIFSLSEMVEEFNLNKVNKSGAVFNVEKLDWINGLYIRQLSPKEFAKQCLPFLQKSNIITDKIKIDDIQKIVALEQNRIKNLSEISQAVNYFFQDIEYEKNLLLWKGQSEESAKNNLRAILNILKDLPVGKFNEKNIRAVLEKYITKNNLKNGEALWPMRAALSGRKGSPGPFEIAVAMGKETTIKKLEQAIKKL